MMHKCDQSVSSIHQTRNSLVAHSYSLVLLINEVLLIRSDSIDHADLKNHTFINVSSKEERIK
jgi:hypothetical protein